MVLPSGEKATEVTSLLCALCFSALSSREAAASTGAVKFGLRVWVCWHRRPASHTLIVWSSEPDTMVLPSGEKATELMQSLCAFSALSSREAAASVGALRFGLGEGSGGLGYLHPRL